MKWRTIGLVWGLALGVGAVAATALVVIPFGSRDFEDRLLWLGLICAIAGIFVAVIVGNIPYYRSGCRGISGRGFARAMRDDPQLRGSYYKHLSACIPVGLISFALMLVTIGREEAASRRLWDCSGKIVQRYRSQNHAAPTIVVKDARGALHTWEGIDLSLYDLARLGDTVTKEAGEVGGTLNGRPIRVVPPHLFDSLRDRD